MALRVLDLVLTEKKPPEDFVGFLALAFAGTQSPTKEQRKNILNTLSDLVGWLRQYLAWKQVASKPYSVGIYALEAFAERKLTVEHDRQEEEIGKMLEDAPDRNLDYYDRLYHLSAAKYFTDRTQKLSGKSDEQLQAAMESLDRFYLCAKLKAACEAYSRANILQERHEVLWLGHLTDWCGQHLDELHPTDSIYLYFHLLLMIRDGRTDSFEQAKGIFLYHPPADRAEQLSLLTYLTNYTAKRIRAGDEAADQAAFDLYAHGLERRLWVEGGRFPIEPFQNIVELACRLNRLEWAADFVEMWKYALPPNAPDVQPLALARIHFCSKNFDQALVALRNVEFSSVSHELRARLLRLQCFYENGEPLSLMSDACNAFAQFLRRNKMLSPEILDSCSRFLRVYRHLIKKEANAKVNSVFLKNQPMACQAWLFEKIGVLRP